MKRALLLVLSAIQIVLAIRFFRRALTTYRSSERIGTTADPPPQATVSVVIPVLNEVNRIGYCLDTLTGRDESIREILVVDGGSSDGTRDLVSRFSATDDRIRLIEAPPRPVDWNGKAWGLHVGLEQSSDQSTYVVSIDADVLVDENSIGQAVAFAKSREVPFLSVANLQDAPSAGLSLVHPSLLSTLAYRFGMPGSVARTLDQVQANGQFAVYKRVALKRVGGFTIARDSICEDVTLARHAFLSGYDVGFFPADNSTSTLMHPSMMECVRNWPRSLGLRDRFDRTSGNRALFEMFFLQVLPILSLLDCRSRGTSAMFRGVNLILIASRIGVLIGTRPSYSRVSWTYWLSPLADPLSFVAIAVNLVRRKHEWRGQQLVEQEIDR